MRIRTRILVIAVLFATPGAAAAQTLSGTVVAADTGAPIGAATVIAIQRTVSHAQRPAAYSAVTDRSGRYTMTVAPGQYQLCVHGAGVYLNPCQWDPARSAVSVTGAAVADLRLQKGAWFIVRIHDTPRLLSQVEAVRGSGVAVHLSNASLGEFPLPLIYEDDRIRDYGLVVPMNVAMRAKVASASVVLGDRAGAPLSAEGVAFQVTPADVPATSAPPTRSSWMFPRSSAKFLHVYTTGRK